MNPRLDFQPLARIETAWQQPWYIAAFSQHGSEHLRNGKGNQDAYRLGTMNGVFWMVVADGVGSRQLSVVGSRLATDVVENFFATAILNKRRPSKELVKEAFQHAHEATVLTAKEAQVPVDEYASTLIATLISEKNIYSGAIGDSSITAYASPELGAHALYRLVPFCTAPQCKKRGATYYIGQKNWDKVATFASTSSPHIKAILMSTDGAEGYFMKGLASTAPTYSDTMIKAFEPAFKKLGPRSMACHFSDYLYQSGDPSDDDRTFIAAYRLPAERAVSA